ncbi:unnamed protein product [Linum tenue]|uniref:TTF-type domain-containing protein n=1 Tax=Linum tenue TaxID=586396 RepID=A0AAV0L5I6_9ROSI|nr:unnamed protein product [Linum tenue]
MVRRYYLQKGPCRPNHNFPTKDVGGRLRSFKASWYKKYHWLEYSIAKDAAYCLHCFLFRSDDGRKGGGASFISTGFKAWNRGDEALDNHVGFVNSEHNKAVRKCEDLLTQSQSIRVALCKQSDQVKKDYRIRLQASIDCIRHCVRQGHALRGHDESESSKNRGNFIELLKFHAFGRVDVHSVVLENAPKNLQMTSPDIQKDIVHAIASEITKEIICDIGENLFSILVDEARDTSIKEQMAVVLRYVNQEGYVMERLLGIAHVSDTKALTLKMEIESILVTSGLSLSRIRGQGYDGASNMSGEINGLKALVLAENSSAYYVHCFAHQLQLTLVAVAKQHGDVSGFFTLITNLINLVGGSCKRMDNIRESQAAKVVEALCCGELETGRGLNQEVGLKRPCDTRWGSHFDTLLNLPVIYSSVIDCLDIIKKEAKGEAKGEASVTLICIQSFDFAFILHMMIKVLAITNELSKSLQRKDQDIVNAMQLVRGAKLRLQDLRDKGWESLLDSVISFCKKEYLPISNMDELYILSGRPRRNAQQITNLHHYKVELFYTVVDMQLQELNSRFDEVNTELLCCVACLNPDDAFADFDKEKLLKLATFYPNEFSIDDILHLDPQLDSYIFDVKMNTRFTKLKGIAELCREMVVAKKFRSFPLVYRLVKLALLLPVATASVERVFSAMNYVKNTLRSRMSDEGLNDFLVGYVESDILDRLDDECILQTFQDMKTRRGSL